jgi:hypothetical protein
MTFVKDLETPPAGDLADVEFSRADDLASIPSIQALSDPDFASLRSSFLKLLVVFFVIAIMSPNKTDHKGDTYYMPSNQRSGRYLLFDLTVANLVHFVSLNVSALRGLSISSLAVPFTLEVDCTQQREFATVAHSRDIFNGSLHFPHNEPKSLPFFSLSLPLSAVDLIELRFNFSSNFSHLSAFSMEATTGSQNAELFAETTRLLFALLAAAIALCFYRRQYQSLPLCSLFFFVFLLALPFSGPISDWVSLGLAFGVRLFLLWHPENGKSGVAVPALALLLSAVARSHGSASTVWVLGSSFLAVVNLLFALRLNAALVHFGLALAGVSALEAAVWRPLGLDFGDFLVESAHCAVAAILLFLLRPAAGESGFQAMRSDAVADANETMIADAADE